MLLRARVDIFRKGECHVTSHTEYIGHAVFIRQHACREIAGLTKRPAGPRLPQQAASGLEDLVKKVPERNLWRTKSKIQFQSYDGDTLRIAVYTSTENTHRAWDPALLKWKLVHTESKFQQNAAIHRDFVDRLEIKTGSKSLVLPGVLIGGMVGIATGAMFVTDEGDWDFSPVYVPFGAAIGFIAGGVIGASMHTEKWQEIPLQQLQSDSMSSR